MSETLRDKISKVLHHNANFSEEQEAAVTELAGRARYGDHRSHPGGYAILCIHALLEHVERLEAAAEARDERLRELYVKLKDAEGKGDILNNVPVRLVEALLNEEQPVY